MNRKKNHPTDKEVHMNGPDSDDELKKLSTEQLKQRLLQESFFSDDAQFDAGLIQRIEAILDERDPLFEELDAQASWNAFREEVIPGLEREKSAADGKSEARPKPGRRVLAKRTLIAAAVLAVLLGGVQIAGAFGFDFWSYVVSWGKETFQIGTGAEVTDPGEEAGASVGDATVDMGDTGSYQSVEDAVEAMDYPLPYPTWTPDGFAFVRADVSKTPQEKGLTALYQSGDKTILYQAVVHKNNDSAQFFEIDENSGETVVMDGTKYYFMTNMGQNRVVWIKDNCVYSISGDITKEELIEMLHSMDKGEK